MDAGESRVANTCVPGGGREGGWMVTNKYMCTLGGRGASDIGASDNNQYIINMHSSNTLEGGREEGREGGREGILMQGRDNSMIDEFPTTVY